MDLLRCVRAGFVSLLVLTCLAVPAVARAASPSGTGAAFDHRGTTVLGTSLRQVWTQPGGQFLHVAGGRVFTIEGDRVFARSLRTGQVLWGPSPVQGPMEMVVDNGQLFLYSDGVLRSWDQANGVQRWVKEVKLQTPIVAAGGRVFGGGPTAVSEADGSVLWSHESVSAFRPVSVSGDTVIAQVAPLCGLVLAYSASTGAKRWQTQVPGGVCSPAGVPIYGGRVYAPGDAVTGRSLDLATGALGGSIPFRDSPAFDGGRLYSNHVGVIEARSLSTSARVWATPNREYIGSPYAVDGRVFAVRPSGVVDALSQTTGQVVWSSSGTKESFGSGSSVEVVADGGVLVVHAGGEMRAFASVLPEAAAAPARPQVSLAEPTAYLPGESSWALLGGNSKHDNNAAPDAFTAPVAGSWSADLGGTSGQVAIVPGAVLALGPVQGGTALHAFDTATGTPLWPAVTVQGQVDGQAQLVSGLGVAVVSTWGNLTGIEVATGRVLWSRPNDDAHGFPNIVGRRLYAQGVVLDLLSGQQWENGPVMAAFDGWTGFGGTPDGGWARYDGPNLTWRVERGCCAYFAGRTQIESDRVIIRNLGASKAWAVGKGTGRLLDVISGGELSARSGNLEVVDSLGGIVATEAGTHRPVWERRGLLLPSFAGDQVVALDLGSSVVGVLSAVSGATLSATSVPGLNIANGALGPAYPAIAQGAIAVSTKRGVTVLLGTNPSRHVGPPSPSPPATPLITRHPVDTTVSAEEPVTFTADAIGIPDPVGQWEVSLDGGTTWAAVPGAVGDTLTIPATTQDLSGQLYRAMYINGIGGAQAWTRGALLTVLPPKRDQRKLTIRGYGHATVGYPFYVSGVLQDGNVEAVSDATLHVSRLASASLPAAALPDLTTDSSGAWRFSEQLPRGTYRYRVTLDPDGTAQGASIETEATVDPLPTTLSFAVSSRPTARTPFTITASSNPPTVLTLRRGSTVVPRLSGNSWRLTELRGRVQYVLTSPGDADHAAARSDVVVDVAGQADSVTLASSAPIVTYGSSARLTIRLAHHDNGTTVDLPNGIHVTVDASGVGSYSVAPARTTTYQAFWYGDRTYAPATSSSVVVRVRPRVSLAATRTGVRAYRFTGGLAPASSRTVSLCARNSDGRVVVLTRTTTDSRGRYAMSYTFAGTGARELFVRSVGDAVLSSADSPHLRLTVS